MSSKNSYLLRRSQTKTGSPRSKGWGGGHFVTFLDRYASEAANCITISDVERVRILLNKLPASALACVSHLPPDCSYSSMREELGRWDYWRQLAAGHAEQSGGRRRADDWMDIDAMELTGREAGGSQGYYGMRDVVIKEGKVDFAKISSYNTLMIAWKHVVSRLPQYREESERYLKRGSAGAHRNRPQGPNLREMQEVLPPEAIDHQTELQTLRREVQQLQSSVQQWTGETELEGYEDQLNTLTLDIHQVQQPTKTKEVGTELVQQSDVLYNSALTGKAESLHLPVRVHSIQVQGLVDTGASANFIQKSLLAKLQKDSAPLAATNRQVLLGDGRTCNVKGTTGLPLHVDGELQQIQFFVLSSKGPPLILGFPFVSSLRLLVDCS